MGSESSRRDARQQTTKYQDKTNKIVKKFRKLVNWNVPGMILVSMAIVSRSLCQCG